MFDLFFEFFGKEKDEEWLAKRTSQKLINFVVHSAFRVYKDEEFRDQFNFFSLDKVEQDRLFNELEITALCFLLFILDSANEWARFEKVIFWQKVRQRVIKDFLNWLKELKIPSQHTLLWRKVIKMRYNEYREDWPKIYQVAGLADPKFIKSNKERRKKGYVRIMTIAIGALYHLRRGKTSPKDAFFKELRTWLEVLNSQLEEKIY